MHNKADTVRLVSSNEPPPAELEAVLRELGAGDTRFRGTSFGRGECDLSTYLKECHDEEDAGKIPAVRVPQRTFWLVDRNNKTLGAVRVRHPLNERLLQYGGHIGYYIRPAERGKGYGTKALQLALEQIRRLGVDRALLTVHPDNLASQRVVLANRGVLDGQGMDPLTGTLANRYWIGL